MNQNSSNEIITAGLFTSVWDAGEYSFTTKCRINLTTREVLDIEPTRETPEYLRHLDAEYVEIEGCPGKYPVAQKDEQEDEPFWHS